MSAALCMGTSKNYNQYHVGVSSISRFALFVLLQKKKKKKKEKEKKRKKKKRKNSKVEKDE